MFCSLLLSGCSSSTASYGALADVVHGGAAPVSAPEPHQAVQRAAFAVQAGAVRLDLRSTVQHNLRTEGEILHQYPPVVQHLALTLAADRTACEAQNSIIIMTPEKGTNSLHFFHIF